MTRQQRNTERKKVFTSPYLKKGGPHKKSNKQKRKGEKQRLRDKLED